MVLAARGRPRASAAEKISYNMASCNTKFGQRGPCPGAIGPRLPKLDLVPQGADACGRMAPLTKSRLAEFEQCEKRFWLSLHRPELAAPRDPAVFATGHTVGA